MIENIKVPWISPKIPPLRVAKAIIFPRLLGWLYLKLRIEGLNAE